MNKKKLINLKRKISEDRFELEIGLARNVKHDILAVLKDYYFVDDKSCNLNLEIKSNGEIELKFSCLIKDVYQSNIYE